MKSPRHLQGEAADNDAEHRQLRLHSFAPEPLEPIADSDSLDWKDLSAGEITKRVTTKVGAGSIVLFHNAAKHTPASLSGIIETLLQDGYTFVPISQIILPQPYTIDHTGRQLPSDNHIS